MSLLSIDELKTLINQHQGLCVSIYMPTYQAGTEIQQNPIRFKNLIKQAGNQLEEQGVRHTDALALLQPVIDLDKEDFWQHQNEGLAIFLADGELYYYRLPLQVDERVVVGDRFHIKPLLPAMTGTVRSTFLL